MVLGNHSKGLCCLQQGLSAPLLHLVQVQEGDICSEDWNNALQVKGVLLSGCISIEQLLLKEGQAWKLFLDIYVLDADGAIFDACLLAAQAALLALKLPSAEINEDGKVHMSASFHSLSVTASAAMSPDSACDKSSRLHLAIGLYSMFLGHSPCWGRRPQDWPTTCK